MQTFNDYLAAYVARRGITSDYQLSKDLGVTRQAVSKYRNYQATPEPDVAWRIADGIGIDPAEVIAAAELARAERSHDERRMQIWSQRLRQMTAALFVVFLGFFHAGDASAAPAPAAKSLNDVYYVKSLYWWSGAPSTAYPTIAPSFRCQGL